MTDEPLDGEQQLLVALVRDALGDEAFAEIDFAWGRTDKGRPALRAGDTILMFDDAGRFTATTERHGRTDVVIVDLDGEVNRATTAPLRPERN